MTVDTARLDRLLVYLRMDVDNLTMREDAVREACSVGQWATALELLIPQFTRDVPSARVLRARCLYLMERRAEAVVECRAFLAVHSDDPEANGLLALILFDEGDIDGARKYAQISLGQDAERLEASLALACVQSESQELEAAGISFAMLLRAHPTCGRGWFGQALLELNRMELDAARISIENATKYLPTHVGTWHLMAWICIVTGDVPQAGLAFRRALALDRNFGETHGGLAVVAALEGREEEARTHLKRAMRLDRQAMSAQYAEFLLLQRHGQLQEAKELLEGFMERPVGKGNLRYRDVVAQRLKQLC